MGGRKINGHEPLETFQKNTSTVQESYHANRSRGETRGRCNPVTIR